MPAPPWSRRTGISAVRKYWQSRSEIRGCFTADRAIEGAEAAYASFPSDIDPRILSALRRRGIEQLYTHQRRAIDAARDGHVVIATPTASGKSLCFHVPVLDAIARDPGATAIYLYPTKALSRDQEQSVLSLIEEAELPIAATVYDGDTPGDARRSARQRCQLVMTNPDMLHAGILPQHAKWARVFQTLRYVIVDEMHTYRGVFGSHVAHVLARLMRVAQFHGSSPRFIGATATIGNPAEHAARLSGAAGDEVALIDESTAPRGSRRVMVYNPPVVNAELSIRASYLKCAVRLASDLIEARVPTIVFGQSRNSVEIMLKYLRDRFEGQSLDDAIVAYRGGYLPDQRRRVERGLRQGDVLCVVATSALELGIDIGDLDAVVCAGYPGSLAETWQRMGRAGRRGDDSLAVLVASSSPLDQYLAHHPELLFDGSIEHARVDPENAEIVVQHLKCAAFELPFTHREPFGVLPKEETEAALGYLSDHGVIHRGRDRFHWSSEAFPANHVSLRSVGWDNYVIIDQATEEALAELDWHSAPSMIHEQAIYQHDGVQYQVETLDHENHKAFVRRVEPDYFTTAMRNIKVRVLEEEDAGRLNATPAEVGWGEVCVTEKIVGYKKIKFHTHENAGYGDVRLPNIEKHTTSFWLTLPASLCSAIGRARAIEGLRGTGHALEMVSTLALMCDPHDIGRAIEDADAQSTREMFSATVYLFDSVPGGVGLAERIYEVAGELVAQAATVVRDCCCAFGCPSCVGATHVAATADDARRGSRLDRKAATLELLAHLSVLDSTSAGAPAETDRSQLLYLVT